MTVSTILTSTPLRISGSNTKVTIKIYLGEFDSDNKSGKGVLYLSNGVIFIGTFESDCINGEGEFRNQENQVIKGVWRNNVLVELTNDE